MPTKTISLRLEAYEKLRRARAYPDESFSDVVLRAKWQEETVTGRQLLELYASRGPQLDEAGLDIVERAKEHDLPPEDKWTKS